VYHRNAAICADRAVRTDHERLSKMLERLGAILALDCGEGTARRAICLLEEAAREHFDIEETAVSPGDELLAVFEGRPSRFVLEDRKA